MKKNFGIDIDDTLLQVWYDKIIQNYNKKFDTNLEFDDIKTHNFNGDKNLEKEFFDFYYKNHSNLEIFDGAKEKLNELRRKYNLFLITSRPKQDIEFTKKDINNIFGKGYFKEIIFTCEYNNDKKCELANCFNFDIVIDDAPHHIENYKNNTKIEKIFIFDQPWNRNIKEDNKRIFRIKSWKDLEI